MKRKTHRLGEHSSCWYCNKTNDAATGVSEGRDTAPKPGDITLCAYCCNFGEYVLVDGRLEIVQPTPEARNAIATNPDAIRAWMAVKSLSEFKDTSDPTRWSFIECPECHTTYITRPPPRDLKPCCGPCTATSGHPVPMSVRPATDNDEAMIDMRKPNEGTPH